MIVLLPIIAALAVEGLAHAWPHSSRTDAESTLMWIAGTQPPFVCGRDGLCRSDLELEHLSNKAPRVFPELASAGTFRVVCLGDSTTAGLPYSPRGGYPEWLGEILRDVLPGRRIEVLNLGFAGWDGTRVESFFGQALSLRPQAVILRVGYNDGSLLLLRHARGGANERIMREAHLFLLARSTAYRLLARVIRPPLRPGFPTGEVVWTADERLHVIAEHRDRLDRLASSAHEAGVPLIVLGIPRRTVSPSPEIVPHDPFEDANAEESRKLGLPFVPLTELAAQDLFVDSVHSNAEGNRLTALNVARSLAALGTPVPGHSWRWERLRSTGDLARAIGMDEPGYRAHLELSLAGIFLGQGRSGPADAHLETALLVAPNPDMIPSELTLDPKGPLRAAYRRIFTRLRREGRVADPRQSRDRELAGLPPR
ncbi:MAG: SGNH/GDSL hydrolase family protein [Elusimicrobiota bacterium]